MTTTITRDPIYGVPAAASVGAGETSAAIYVPNVCTVWVTPGAGGTMYAEATGSSRAAVDAGTANWFTWDAGTVGAKTAQRLEGATAIRFTAITQAGTGEVVR